MTAIVALLIAPFAILTAFFAVEVIAGLPRRGSSMPGAADAAAVILIPAHDEAAVICDTLRHLKTAVGERMRILVVADNCTDSTADLARKEGVEVIVRSDLARRGKGHALAFAVDHLRSDPPDVIAVLDADCTVDRASLSSLVGASAASGSPAQAVNLLRPVRGDPLVQLSTFAFALKNLVRQRGLQRLTGRAHLTGTGMAMPFALFQASEKARSSIVEDLDIGIELAEAGRPPRLVAESVVWSNPSTEQGTLVQRRRWEGGFLASSLKQGPRLIFRGIVKARPRTVFAGLDLLVPPLALFAVMNVVVLLLTAVLTSALRLEWWPVVSHAGLLGLSLVAVFTAWLKEGRAFVSLGVLARIPMYVLWKLPMYVGLARTGTPKEWLRTGR